LPFDRKNKQNDLVQYSMKLLTHTYTSFYNNLNT